MITLSSSQVKFLHNRLIAETGGMDGIRDEGLLDSALSAPFQTFDDADLYPSTIAKIARIAIEQMGLHSPTPSTKKEVDLILKAQTWLDKNSQGAEI